MKKITIITIILVCITSSAFGWGLGAGGFIGGGGCPACSGPPFIDMFNQCLDDGSAPCTENWGDVFYYPTSGNCAAGSVTDIQSNALKFHLKSNTGATCCPNFPTKTTLPVASGRYFSVTSSTWGQFYNISASAFVYLQNSSNMAGFVSSWDNSNSLQAQIIYQSGSYRLQLHAYNSSNSDLSYGRYNLGSDVSGSHTLKIYLVDSTHVSVYWDSTLAFNNTDFSTNCDLGSNVYGGVIAYTNVTTSFLDWIVTSASFQ